MEPGTFVLTGDGNTNQDKNMHYSCFWSTGFFILCLPAHLTSFIIARLEERVSEGNFELQCGQCWYKCGAFPSE